MDAKLMEEIFSNGQGLDSLPSASFVAPHKASTGSRNLRTHELHISD